MFLRTLMAFLLQTNWLLLWDHRELVNLHFWTSCPDTSMKLYDQSIENHILIYVCVYLSLKGVRGDVTVNGEERRLDSFRRLSCYIQQDDRLQPLLTVNENMHVAANLKLSMDKTQKYKDAVVRHF